MAVHRRAPHRLVRGDQMRHTMSNGVIINDAYAAQTEAEQDEVDTQIATAAWSIVEEIVARGEAV